MRTNGSTILCLWGAIVLAHVAAAPRQGTTAQTTAGGVVRGYIRDAGGRPLEGASILLMQPSALIGDTSVKPVTTDATGAYTVAGIPAGSYRVSAGKPPYLSREFHNGRTAGAGQGILLPVAAGQVLDGINIVLPAGGSISGRVLDENGEPVQGVGVVLFRVETVFERKAFTIPYGIPGSPSDDRGHYRRYAVPPGRYIVSTLMQPGATVLPEYAPRAFYPGTVDPGQAQIVTVGLSQEVTNIDLQMLRVRTVKVAGQALDSTGKPMRGSVTLQPSVQAGGPVSGLATPAAGGRFEIGTVTPGEYILRAVRPQLDPQTEPEFIAQRLTVGETDVEVALQTSRTSTLTGRVVFEGAPPTMKPQTVTVSAVAADPALAWTAPQKSPRPANPDGTFQLAGLVGPQRLQLAAAPAGWMLKAVWVNGQDMTDRPIVFDAKQPLVRNVELVLSNRAGGLTGSVADATGRPATDYALVVYAADPERWYQGTRFVRLVRPDQGGHFTVPSLPSAQYYVAALEWIEGDGTSGEWQDPKFLTDLRNLATLHNVVEGQTGSLALRLIAR